MLWSIIRRVNDFRLSHYHLYSWMTYLFSRSRRSKSISARSWKRGKLTLSKLTLLRLKMKLRSSSWEKMLNLRKGRTLSFLLRSLTTRSIVEWVSLFCLCSFVYSNPNCQNYHCASSCSLRDFDLIILPSCILMIVCIKLMIFKRLLDDTLLTLITGHILHALWWPVQSFKIIANQVKWRPFLSLVSVLMAGSGLELLNYCWKNYVIHTRRLLF